MDQHLISSRQLPAIQRVMGGRFVQQVICRGHDFKSEREEDFYQISVDVRGMGTLEKSLENYVQVRGVLLLGHWASLLVSPDGHWVTGWSPQGTQRLLSLKSPNHIALPALCAATLTQCASLNVQLLLLLLLVAKSVGPETHAVVPVQLCCVGCVALRCVWQ